MLLDAHQPQRAMACGPEFAVRRIFGHLLTMAAVGQDIAKADIDRPRACREELIDSWFAIGQNVSIRDLNISYSSDLPFGYT